MVLNQLILILAVSTLCLAQHTVYGQYLSPQTQPEYFEPFPKIVWVFWATGLDEVKLWTKLCINNINHFSKQSGFQFRFLTDQNYTQYLSAESNERLENLLKNEKDVKTQQKASMLRGFLMYENGGIWIDAHTTLISNFTWLQTLYKQPVYNRFFPNPQVVFFSKNKDYSGNKTIIFDEKVQQPVYLFPGMQNWFLIAKPKSKFFRDLLYSFERYVKLGREQILKDSQKKGIKFAGQSYYYFKFGSFQLQLVLQGKQKQLDQIQNPPFKYAVQYYKMWNIYSEYTGFILGVHLQQNQKVDFQFEHDEESLQKLYKFPIKPEFIKDTGDVTVSLQKQFSSSFNKSCFDVPNTVQKKSFVYKYMINISSMFKQIDQIKETFSFFQGKCNPLALTVDYFKISIFIIKILLLAAVFTPCIYKIHYSNKIKRPNYTRIISQP